MVSITRVTIRIWARNKKEIKKILEDIDRAVINQPTADWEIYRTKEVPQK